MQDIGMLSCANNKKYILSPKFKIMVGFYRFVPIMNQKMRETHVWLIFSYVLNYVLMLVFLTLAYQDIAGTLATEEAEDAAQVAKLRSALESVDHKRRKVLSFTLGMEQNILELPVLIHNMVNYTNWYWETRELGNDTNLNPNY